MLTKLIIRNFKTLEFVEVALGQNVVLIGPNNSGKTSALQALALWNTGLREWSSRKRATKAKQRTAVSISRKSLTHTPTTDARLLWHDLKVSSASRENGKQETSFIRMEVSVEGELAGQVWQLGFEFQYANSETLYCRPIASTDDVGGPIIPQPALEQKIALLPPMSGLVSEEAELQPGRVSVLIGEGQTAQVLRNLCLQVFASSAQSWLQISSEIERIFGVRLSEPRRDPSRGTVELGYQQGGIELDLPSAGRGLQQTLLLLAHQYANPGSTLLLDEPDAHLEILRQRQIYSLITDTAQRTGSQIIAASHSEVMLNEAADKDVVVAFLGKPHRIDDRGSQVLKSLKQIGFEHYYQAEQRGFVLYLEGATDLAILRTLAKTLGHRSFSVLDQAFVHYIANQPNSAMEHFFGLREAKPDLVAVAVFDRLERGLPNGFSIPSQQWRKREIENYLCSRVVLERYAEGMDPDDLIGLALKAKRLEAMQNAIERVESALKELGKDAWSADIKSSDEVLPVVFKRYFEALGVQDRLQKSDYHVLAGFIRPDEIDPEVVSALDLILSESSKAAPVG